MEAVSLAVAFPGFINDGIELKHRFQAAKSFQTEASQARILLKSNLTRLQIWEEKAGIKDGELADNHDPTLDDPDVLSNVHGHLRTAKQLSAKIEKALARLSPEAANPTATRSRLPFPSRSGMKWGFGHDKTILDDLQKFDKHVEKLYQLFTPKLGEDREHSRILGTVFTLYDVSVR
ncbi:uncharacterized protein LTHEOB_10051 [Lasiodiplodia theobromae]|uniref:uncharacterized protein n=1 Tax=Lasiodiplodia theobromae TaxID=45133 RepID=UPI0015C2E04E|nr:uncharacterized protein LTHEOB_10051 [Lasiodiplodia theobromae]KAF4539662.1 hypothetical protein LTHEOB_10051 [Lasiodiplodia theobromae]